MEIGHLSGIVLSILLSTTIISCGADSTAEEISNEAIDALQIVKEKRIFFGHQSVGTDILQGIEELARETVNNIKIVELDDNSKSTEADIIEASIGRNVYPDEKIYDFAHIMRSGIAEDVDIAFMKFCYIDSNSDMTEDEIVESYINEMENLEKEFPHVTFIYFTMPLEADRNDFSSIIKRIPYKILNKPIYYRERNVKRNNFNDLLIAAKGDTGRVFDLAKFESTNPDGKAETFGYKGRRIRVLVPMYTDDGGHLNQIGRRYVAEQLLLFLSQF